MLRGIIGVAVFVLGFGSEAEAVVWRHGGTWNESRQTQFSQWVETNAHYSMALVPKAPYYAVPIDCADLLYYLTGIYAYENGLEFAVRDIDGQVISNSTARFDHIQNEAERVKAFLIYVVGRTNTTTLARNSILLPISRNAIRPGTFLLSDKPTQHTWIVHGVHPTGYLTFLTATSPETLYIFPGYSFPKENFAFKNAWSRGRLRSDVGGFRRLYWPSELIRRPKDSTEQLEIPLASYFATIQDALLEYGHAKETPSQKLDRLLDETCMQMRVRTNIVTEAFIAQSKGTLTKAKREEISTPQRDREILDLIRATKEHFETHARELDAATAQKYFRFYAEEDESGRRGRFHKIEESETHCLVQWAENRTERLAPLVQRFHRATQDALDQLEWRWGDR